jgi:hypothetical protein
LTVSHYLFFSFRFSSFFHHQDCRAINISPADNYKLIIEKRQGISLTEDSTYPEGTVNHAVPNRLRELAIKLKDFGKQGKESEESEGK